LELDVSRLFGNSSRSLFRWIQRFKWKRSALNKQTIIQRRRRREDNNKMVPRGMEFGYVDWIHVAQENFQWRGLVIMILKLLVL